MQFDITGTQIPFEVENK